VKFSNITIVAPLHIKMHQISDRLPTHVPRKSFVHHPQDGGQLKDSLARSSPIGNPHKGPPFNPSVGSF
jgi:hypothetical protein